MRRNVKHVAGCSRGLFQNTVMAYCETTQ